LSTYDIMI